MLLDHFKIGNGCADSNCSRNHDLDWKHASKYFSNSQTLLLRKQKSSMFGIAQKKGYKGPKSGSQSGGAGSSADPKKDEEKKKKFKGLLNSKGNSSLLFHLGTFSSEQMEALFAAAKI